MLTTLLFTYKHKQNTRIYNIDLHLVNHITTVVQKSDPKSLDSFFLAKMPMVDIPRKLPLFLDLEKEVFEWNITQEEK